MTAASKTVVGKPTGDTAPKHKGQAEYDRLTDYKKLLRVVRREFIRRGRLGCEFDGLPEDEVVKMTGLSVEEITEAVSRTQSVIMHKGTRKIYYNGR